MDRVSRSYMVSPEEFTFARGLAGDTPVKATVSSPLLLHFLWHPDHSPKAYDDPYELFAEAADLLREAVEELARLGCRYVQVDAPELIHVMADESVRDHWREIGVDPERVIPEGIEFDDERSGGFEPLAELPDGLTAVLGLVSTKWDAVEARDAVLRREVWGARWDLSGERQAMQGRSERRVLCTRASEDAAARRRSPLRRRRAASVLRPATAAS